VTGPEHYAEAERLLAPGEHDEDSDAYLVLRDIAAAQVHAILAHTAAVALPGGDYEEWIQVIREVTP